MYRTLAAIALLFLAVAHSIAQPAVDTSALRDVLRAYGLALMSFRDHGDGTYTVRVRRQQQSQTVDEHIPVAVVPHGTCLFSHPPICEADQTHIVVPAVPISIEVPLPAEIPYSLTCEPMSGPVCRYD